MYIGLTNFGETLSMSSLRNKTRCVSVLDYADDGNIKTTSVLDDKIKKKLQIEGYVNLDYEDDSLICELCFCEDVPDKVRQIIIQRLKDKKVYYNSYKNCIARIKLLGIKPDLDFSEFSLIYKDLRVRASLYDSSVVNDEDNIFCSFMFFNEVESDLEGIFYNTLLTAFRDAHKNRKSIKTLDDLFAYRVISEWGSFSTYTLEPYKEYRTRPLNVLLDYYVQKVDERLFDATPSLIKENDKSRQILICLNKDGLHIFDNYTILGWSRITFKPSEFAGSSECLIPFKDFKLKLIKDKYDVIFKINKRGKIKWIKCN